MSSTPKADALFACLDFNCVDDKSSTPKAIALFSKLDFTCRDDRTPATSKANAHQFAGLDSTCTESDIDAQDDADVLTCSSRPAVSSTTEPTNPVAFPKKRTLQKAQLRWAKPLVSTIMPNASRAHVQQLNELLHAIRTPDGLQRVYQAMKGRQQEQECSKICNALKTTLTQGKTEDTQRKQHTVAQLIKRGRRHQKLVHAYYLFIMYHTCNQSLFLFIYRKR